VSVSGEDFIDELGLAGGQFEKWDRDLEDVIFKLETGRPLDAYTKEDTVRLLSDFWDLLARLDDLRSIELVGDDDEDEEEEEEEEGAKAATSPDAASLDAAAVGGDR
jgi:hypothetical protein